MERVHLGFKAFDMHELLCHFVAREAGLYQRAGLEVRLLDTTFIPDERLPDRNFQVACGAALMSWLQGTSYRVVMTAVDRPMFWLYARPGIAGLQALTGERIAGFPVMAPPAHFLSAILSQQGLTENDLNVEAVRDDTARLGLLRSGEVAAAVISSAYIPGQVAAMGYQPLVFFGSCLRVPTTGLAVTERQLEQETDLVEKMVHVFRRSLELIHSDRDLLGRVLADYFQVPDPLVTAGCDLAQHCFSQTGRCENQVGRAAVAMMAEQLGRRADSAYNLYDFRFLE